MARKSIAVLYHMPCTDGVFAAAAAYKALGDRALYIPLSFSAEVDELEAIIVRICDCECIHFLDTVGPQGFMQKLYATIAESPTRCPTASIIINDHHKTAFALRDTIGYPPCTVNWKLDMNHSGAVLAWNHFNIGEPVPPAFALVEDEDLWRFRLPDTKAWTAGFRETPLPAVPDAAFFEHLLTIDPTAVIEKGKTLLVRRAELVQELADDSSIEVVLAGYKCLQVTVDENTPEYGVLSELGEELAKRSQACGYAPMGAVVTREVAGTKKLSLRSLGDFDCSAIAVKYGGGGHRNASGVGHWKGDE